MDATSSGGEMPWLGDVENGCLPLLRRPTAKAPGGLPINRRRERKQMSSNGADQWQARADFDDAVNKSGKELERWLDTEESKSVGQSDDGGESKGHHSGRQIVKIKSTKVSDLTDDDYRHMRKVVGYVHRHLAQRPKGDVTDTKWRYSLMNWGHDPLK